MVIGIELNEVLRDFIGQLKYTYDKYIVETDVKEGDVKTFDLIKYFPFENLASLNRFIYSEAPLEIFGHADQLHDGLMVKLNKFLMDIEDEEEHSLMIVSREIDKSVPATYFFLSKLNCRIGKVNFVKAYEDEWNDVDVLITANPTVLKLKPKNKISVKVKSSYNEDSKADFEIDSIIDFIENEEIRNKVLNTKTIKYEEI